MPKANDSALRAAGYRSRPRRPAARRQRARASSTGISSPSHPSLHRRTCPQFEDRLRAHEGLRHRGNRVHRRSRRSPTVRARRRGDRARPLARKGAGALRPRRHAGRRRHLRSREARRRHAGLRRRNPRRRHLRGRHPQVTPRADAPGKRRRHRERAGCSARRRGPAGRLHLDDRRLREHQRRGCRRDLRPSRQGLHLVLRGDEVRGAPGRQEPDRRRPAVRDGPAGRRLRPRRPLGARQADPRLRVGPDAARPLPDAWA